MPNILNDVLNKNINDIESTIKEIHDEFDSQEKKKYKQSLLNIEEAINLLKHLLNRPLSKLFMEYYFRESEEAITPPELQFNQCRGAISAQLSSILKGKESAGKSISKIQCIEIILGSHIKPEISRLVNEFKELYSWDQLEKLKLNKEYFNKVECDPSCFAGAIKLGLNQDYIQKALDNPDYFKDVLGKLITKNKIEIALDAFNLEKVKICENISFSETKSFLQQNPGCIARKSKNHPDKIVFAHISPEGYIQQHLIQFENNFWVLRSGPEEQLGKKLGATLIDIARDNGGLLHLPNSVKRWQSQQAQPCNSLPESFFFDRKEITKKWLHGAFQSLEEPDFFYHKSLVEKNSPPEESSSAKQQSCRNLN
ncbi:hypothetical protein [Piscirickettsia salmonis]|uniref:hypothetical protein n=1 Tax=Piscirickettsia salmonis TaxID=1238 RepID=UPI0007C996CC|nr:hypothetical protein A0O36_02788 [Piscirickettsiaceae bacterium NZ-RLO1]